MSSTRQLADCQPLHPDRVSFNLGDAHSVLDVSSTSRSQPGFDHDTGWALLAGFLSSDDVDITLSECRSMLTLPPPHRRAGDKPGAGTHHLFELDDRSTFFDDMLDRHEIIDVVTEILGPSFARDQVSYRSPQPSFGSQYLHADAPPMLRPGPATVATAIVALVPFTDRNGATRLVPGSHRRPDLQRESGRLEHHAEQILLMGPAGTAFVFSGHVLHSGTVNESSAERPALQLVWRTSP